MMSKKKFEQGERVRHARRPEWGVGTVTKAEEAHVNGHVSQNVSVRFPNAGLKMLNTLHAELERQESTRDPLADHYETNGHSVAAWDTLKGAQWLDGMADKKIEQVMISLPSEARDPFSSLAKRLTFTFALYRFDISGRGLLDWAVAQSGLDDPLSRFNRHELERQFQRWSIERDSHLAKLLQDARDERGAVQTALKNAPPAAHHAVRRLTASR